MHEMSPEQIKQREQEDPNNIDKVPIEAGHFDRHIVFAAVCVFATPSTEPRHQPEADDHVQGMKPGHYKIDPKEYPDLIAKLIRVDLTIRKIADLLGSASDIFSSTASLANEQSVH